MSIRYLSHDDLIRALSLRDLTNPQHGIHAMQQLIKEVQTVITSLLPSCYLQRLNPNPIVCVHDNYDALGYPTEGAARDTRYSRYIAQDLMLRTQTSSAVSNWLMSWQDQRPAWLGLLCHGLVYRRDCIDKWHSSEPHQLDIWLIMPKDQVNEDTILDETLHALVKTLLPEHTMQVTPSPHPYTKKGVQIDILTREGEQIEIGECGLIDPRLLEKHGWSNQACTGIAIGLGLDRVLMLRKGIPDIRLFQDPEPRVQSQMQTLAPWKPVSRQPITERDISIVVDNSMDMDILGDKVRETLKEKVDWVEDIKCLSKTAYSQLPESAQIRLGMSEEQDNLLLRLVLRHPSKSIPTALANDIRNQVYLALNEGSRTHLARNS